MEQQAKDILQQEPQTEALPAGSEDLRVNGYVAYLNLDWLNQVFCDAGWYGQPDKQQEFIDETQQMLADVVSKREGKPNVMTTYSWYDKDGSLRRAIEVMPVAASANGLTIVTPDVTGYDALNKRLDEAQATIHKLQSELEQTKHRLERVMRKNGMED